MNHNTQYEIARIQMDIHDQKVNHILHLILSFITCGVWMAVWLLVALSSSIECSRLRGKMSKVMARSNA